jgi:hypothetical protein
MTTLALGRRELAAHPPLYHGRTCAQVHVRRHVHDTSGDVLYPMPDACAACGRAWFAEDESTYMGYCGDCWPGNSMLWDWSDGVEVVPATYPQPVRHREPARGRASVAEPIGIVTTDPDHCVACQAMRIKYDQATAACAAHRRSYPDLGAAFDRVTEAHFRGTPLSPEEIARIFGR